MRSDDCLPENQAKLTGHKWCDQFDCDCVCHDTDQPDGYKAEMIGACRLTTLHDRHDWHYSYTGYAECPGVPNHSDGES